MARGHTEACSLIWLKGKKIQNNHNTGLYLLLATLSLAVLLIVGCGGGGSDSDSSQPQILSGFFIDSAVGGLHYQTATQQGITDSNGTFYYMEGESISFFMGDVTLGEGMASTYMSPIDLVPGARDETHPTVTNMTRFLMTMDEDQNPDNGIYIPSEIVMEMTGYDVNFNMLVDDFDSDSDVVMLMDDLGNINDSYDGRTMVTAAEAQNHMLGTLMEMADLMNGTPGTMHRGVFLDSAVEGLHYVTDTLSGKTTGNGAFSFMDGETVRFYIGMIPLGEGTAQYIMTPIDLVPGAMDVTDHTVTNISRFLQTMDNDNDPSNGIMIPENISQEMDTYQINFEMSPEAFEQDYDFQMLMDTLGNVDMDYGGRQIVSSESAQDHMLETLIDIEVMKDEQHMGDPGGMRKE